MSTFISGVMGTFGDRNVALVNKIAARTREGKIAWLKTANGLGAYISGKLRMNFVEAPLAALFASRWVLFVVRDEAGTEVLKVENNATAMPVPNSSLEPEKYVYLSALLSAGDPLVSAVTELHNLILSQIPKAAVERAIDLLDTI